jgi:hypothetical protein
MATAKDIVLKPIKSKRANEFIKRVHYSGKVAQNSQIHIGVFLHGRLEGAMQFGPSLDKRKLIGLVDGTQWHQFIELNRLAFTDVLPRNSESRALSIAFKLLRKHAPQLKWVISFADATQCGDGTIYRASGFVLTSIKPNGQLYRLPFADELDEKPLLNAGLDSNEIIQLRAWLDSITKGVRHPVAHKLSVEDRPSHKMSLQGAPHAHKMSLEGRQRPNQLLSAVKEIMRKVTSGATSADRLFKLMGGYPAKGYQLRYIYFLDKSWRDRLTVDTIPFDEIKRAGASMYKGKKQCAGD